MPLTRKIISLSNSSKGVTLPKSWLDLLEEKHGKIETVSMEVNDKLVIRPIFRKSFELQKGEFPK